VTAVSVIVPFFNAAASLPRCLEALLQQDEPAGGYEIIAVDNNSTDASGALARRYPAVRLFSETRQSAYAARNRGLQAASGELIAFTDADCVARADWLRQLTEAMRDERAMVAMGRDRPAGASLAVRLLGAYGHCKEAFVMTSGDATLYFGHTNNLIARRELFRRVGPFDERPRGADMIFVHRVVSLYGTGAVRYVPNAVVDHLEITAAHVYFRKAFIYGRSARQYAEVVPAPVLRHADRLRILRETVRVHHLSAAETALLVAMLVLGVGFYNLGRRSVRASSAPTGAGAAAQPREVEP